MHPLGMVWYYEADYEHSRSLMLDRDKLPSSYDEWLAAALRVESAAINIGLTVIRAHITWNSFLAWCLKHKVRPDLNGRSQYAFSYALDIFVDQIRNTGKVERRLEGSSPTH